MITKEELHSMFDYCDGELIWKNSYYKRKNGKPAGWINNKGYKYVTIGGRNGTKYKVHRLIWLYHYGEMPSMIDHINSDRSDNRIENLRSVSGTQNNVNGGAKPKKKGIYKGVHWDKNTGKWRAGARLNGRNHYLGLFTDEDAAHKAYCEFMTKHHGENFTPVCSDSAAVSKIAAYYSGKLLIPKDHEVLVGRTGAALYKQIII